jgi:hypothetical protein
VVQHLGEYYGVWLVKWRQEIYCRGFCKVLLVGIFGVVDGRNPVSPRESFANGISAVDRNCLSGRRCLGIRLSKVCRSELPQ